MAVKLLVILIIVYLIARAAANLWRAVTADPAAASSRDRDEVRREVRGQVYEQTWHFRQPPSTAHERSFSEDARWRDV